MRGFRTSEQEFRMAHIVLALMALVCAGCGTPDPQAEPREERVYRTGSNIAVRDRDAKSGVESADPESVRRSMTSGPPPTPVGGVRP